MTVTLRRPYRDRVRLLLLHQKTFCCEEWKSNPLNCAYETPQDTNLVLSQYFERIRSTALRSAAWKAAASLFTLYSHFVGTIGFAPITSELSVQCSTE